MNTIDRTYRSRRKDIHVTELADFAAVPERRQETRDPVAPDGLLSVAPLPSVYAFRDAGWAFVPRAEADHGARVYLQPSGQVVIGTDRLTVRVGGPRTEAEAKAVLEKLGVRVVERLRLAPNLFIVAVPPGGDALEAAARLSDSGEVDFAEPEFIELISTR